MSFGNSCVSNPEIAVEPMVEWEPSGEREVLCAKMCTTSIAIGCEMTNSIKRCAQNCAESVELTGPCEPETLEYVACLGDVGLESCFEVPQACDEAWLTWSMCSASGTGCGPVMCDQEEGGCLCQSFCAGALVEEGCTQVEDGWDCTCSIDGMVVSSCTAMPTSCAFFIGCCSPFVGN